MSDAAKSVFRLLDIVVEEVSLVDRAANKHRFLIVKRSEMDGDTSDEALEGTETDDPTPDAADDLEEHENEEDHNEEADASAEDEDVDDTEPSERPAFVQETVDALTKLTSIVETLETNPRGPKVQKARAALRALATQLEKASKPKGRRRGKPTPEEDEEVEDDEETQEKSSLSEIRAALTRLQALVSAMPGGGAKPKAARVRARKQSGDADRVASKLDAIATHLGTVAAGLKEHTQRLSRLEKHAGVPNSAPVGEGGARREDEDGFWSLDLNKPSDRASVDKTISFHDIG